VRRNDVKQAEFLRRPYGSQLRLAGKEHDLRNLTVLVMTVLPGTHTPMQFHPQEEVFYVLEGSCILRTEGTELKLDKDSAGIVLPNEHHSIASVGDRVCKLLVVVSPQREAATVTYLEQV
jgi:quercetin dioxygenase-like cupin family protein